MVVQVKDDGREAQEIRRAAELIRLGARLQLLEPAINLSGERVLALYDEVEGNGARVTLPSTPADWFLGWLPNVHSSLFVGLWRYLRTFCKLEGINAIAKAYSLYLSHIQATASDPILTVTRAWSLVQHLGMALDTTYCRTCGADLVVRTDAPRHDAVCGLCRVPSPARDEALLREMPDRSGTGCVL